MDGVGSLIDEFMLFAALAAVNVMTPGPGVVLTLTNAVHHRARHVFAGIIGIASGTFVVASLTAMGVGAVLTASSLAFTIMKYAGAAYLIYLGIKIWRAPALQIDDAFSDPAGGARRFAEGFVLQVSNPNAILFFLALFPQFIDHHADRVTWAAALVAGYAALVVLIHSLYAAAALRARNWLSAAHGGRWVNRISGGAFILCGVALAASSPRAPR